MENAEENTMNTSGLMNMEDKMKLKTKYHMQNFPMKKIRFP